MKFMFMRLSNIKSGREKSLLSATKTLLSATYGT